MGGSGGVVCFPHLYDVANNLSSADEQRHGGPKQAPRHVQADLVPVEHGDVVALAARARAQRAARPRWVRRTRRGRPRQLPAPRRRATLRQRATEHRVARPAPRLASPRLLLYVLCAFALFECGSVFVSVDFNYIIKEQCVKHSLHRIPQT